MRRQKTGIMRQDSRLSVKSLIESIENAQKDAKIRQDAVDSTHCSSTSSINSLSSDNHHHHNEGHGGDVVDNGEYCFENGSQLITFSRSQSHHGATTDWIESSNNNNNNNGSSNNQVSVGRRSKGGILYIFRKAHFDYLGLLFTIPTFQYFSSSQL